MQLSTDVSWQLAKDADGPDGKMKTHKKIRTLRICTSDKKIDNLGKIKMIQNGHRVSNPNTILRQGKNAKKFLDNPIYRF